MIWSVKGRCAIWGAPIFAHFSFPRRCGSVTSSTWRAGIVFNPRTNLLARDVEYELLPLCADEGVGVCVFSPMAAGFLSGKYKKDAKPVEGARFSLTHLGFRYNQGYWDDANLRGG